eukprot:890719-Rhodomonas_salina.2
MARDFSLDGVVPAPYPATSFPMSFPVLTSVLARYSATLSLCYVRYRPSFGRCYRTTRVPCKSPVVT